MPQSTTAVLRYNPFSVSWRYLPGRTPVPKAIVDPDDLHRFAVDLKRFSGEVQVHLAGIHRQFGKLGETWQDQEHAKFAGEFLHMVSVMKTFVTAADEQAPVLLRKAEAIRRYLDSR
jgi:uncharacterized protein YukE